jgi:hypothetical protein
MLTKDALIKLNEEVVKCAKLESTLKAKGFTVPNDLTARKAELQFVHDYIVNCYHPNGKTFAEVWKFAKIILTKLESEQCAYVERNDEASAWIIMKIKEHRRVLKILETMFPDEVKAVEAVTAITPQAIATWLQSKPSEEDIMSVMSMMKSYAPTAYAKFIIPDTKQAQIDLLENLKIFGQ